MNDNPDGVSAMSAELCPDGRERMTMTALRIKTEEHDCCAEDLIQLRAAAGELLRQIDINDFADSNGHALKNFKAVHDLLRVAAA